MNLSKTIQIQINKEYYDLVPRPSKIDYKSLKNSIENDGQQLPIIVNQNGVILDGHTRNDICKELGINPIFEVMKFDDEFDEKRFVITANLSRRSLNLFQKAEVLQFWWKQQMDTRYKRSGAKTTKHNKGIHVKPAKRLHAKLGDMLGCAHTISYKAFWLIQNAPEKIKRMLRKGTITISTAYAQLFQNGKLLDYYRKYDKSNKNRYPFCIRCKSKTTTPEKTKCHVHSQQCCTKCGWGF